MNNNEQLDMIHDVLGHLIQKVNEFDTKLSGLQQNTSPDYSAEFERVNQKAAVIRQELAAFMTKILFVINSQGEKTAAMPQTIYQKHHHHFDLKSKGFIISAAILLIVTAFSTGLSLSLWTENQVLHDDALKYRMVRFINPTTARWTDSIYYRNPDAAEHITLKFEAAKQTDAADKVQQASRQNHKGR